MTTQQMEVFIWKGYDSAQTNLIDNIKVVFKMNLEFLSEIELNYSLIWKGYFIQ
jgi:hypothetical protein